METANLQTYKKEYLKKSQLSREYWQAKNSDFRETVETKMGILQDF